MKKSQKVLQELKIDDKKKSSSFAMAILVTMLLSLTSPVRPKIMEAEIIHMIDNLDAEMMMMTTAQWSWRMTNKIFLLWKIVPSINRISTSKNRDKYGNDSAKIK